MKFVKALMFASALSVSGMAHAVEYPTIDLGDTTSLADACKVALRGTATKNFRAQVDAQALCTAQNAAAGVNVCAVRRLSNGLFQARTQLQAALTGANFQAIIGQLLAGLQGKGLLGQLLQLVLNQAIQVPGSAC